MAFRAELPVAERREGDARRRRSIVECNRIPSSPTVCLHDCPKVRLRGYQLVQRDGVHRGPSIRAHRLAVLHLRHRHRRSGGYRRIGG